MLSRFLQKAPTASIIRSFSKRTPQPEKTEFETEEHRRQYQARRNLRNLSEDDITANPTSDFSEAPLFTLGHNYNQEENPSYATKIEWAKKQRQIIEDVKNKPFKSRLQRVVYDKPKYDTDISEYDCWQEYGDMQLTKEYPREHKVVCKIAIAPKTMLHVFGDSLFNYRNENYSTKEWDFVDSNLDRFLVYDYKSSTHYYGDNKDDAYYDVSTHFYANLIV